MPAHCGSALSSETAWLRSAVGQLARGSAPDTLQRVATPTRTIAALVVHLRSPEAGAVGQGVRFAVAGVVVAIIYLATTTGLHEVLKFRFQVALVLGTATGLLAHFTL